eukprot:2914280-Alexandrium_andersonii.AAC.1
MRAAGAPQRARYAGSPVAAWKRCRSPGVTGTPRCSTIPRGPAGAAPMPQGEASAAMAQTAGARRACARKLRARGPCADARN